MERGHALSVESTYFHSIPEFDSIADASLIVALETYFMQSQLIKKILLVVSMNNISLAIGLSTGSNLSEK